MGNNNGQQQEEREPTPCWLEEFVGLKIVEDQKGQSVLGAYIYLETEVMPKVHWLAMLAFREVCKNLDAITKGAQGTDYQRYLEDLSATLVEVAGHQLTEFPKCFRKVLLETLGPDQLE